MRILPIQGIALLAALVSAPGLMTGCATSDASGDETQSVGTIKAPLIAYSLSGNSYRLRHALIAATGPTVVVHETETDLALGLNRVSFELPPGEYDVLLAAAPGESKWQVERIVGDGTFEPVDAVLLSENPQAVTVTSNNDSFVVFSMLLDDEEVVFEPGGLEVAVQVFDFTHCDFGASEPSCQSDQKCAPIQSYEAAATIDQGVCEAAGPVPHGGECTTNPTDCADGACVLLNGIGNPGNCLRYCLPGGAADQCPAGSTCSAQDGHWGLCAL